MTKILFAAYGGGHINAVLPVIKYVQRHTDWDIEVLGLTTAGKKLEEEGIPYIGYKDIIEPDDQAAYRIGRDLVKQLDTKLVSYEESVAYMGLSYMDLVNRFGEVEAKAIFAEKGRQGFLQLTVMERLLKKVKPDLVVATNSPRSEQALITCASILNIPSICLVDLFGFTEIEWIKDRRYGNKVCVLDKRIKDFFIMKGRDESDIVVTGNPAFDYLTDNRLMEEGESLKARKHWKDKKVILWASQPEPGNEQLPRLIEQRLMECVKKHDDWILLLRFHPSEDIKYSELPDRVEINKDNLHPLLHAVDLVVTMTSTVGLEAALLGKPVITVDLSVYTTEVAYSNLGISKGITDLEQLEEALIIALTRQGNCEWENTSLGQSTLNVMKVVRSLVDC
ncbi:CDP-glycerol glycerophosphotransferase family protein [Cohnella phaseoli]|uniref:CDP-glycerol:poly(Glycerophosphate) glycerophosphotransferase n=1 Tax=Cohnella phaseoli TaxID=456490 RepID=A0A3D9KD40_9BACL|nr:CDP-glycerol glycerophosphotransferase family protein [Cohnella phaseoli]RED84025.1 CDP-glycerol:poly(glycerophosphate) glycerophosphotransferase [Cohnella phaseoli]